MKYPYTRVVEYKHFLHQKSPHTLLFREYPVDDGEPYYPVPTERNMRLYADLQRRAKETPRVFFVGRLANYTYMNMDEAVANALSVFDAPAAAELHVVTNAYKSDLAWMSELCAMLPDVSVRWFVFDKNPQPMSLPSITGACRSLAIEYTHVPKNVGREGLSWLRYMLGDSIGPLNLFLQGRPDLCHKTLRNALSGIMQIEGFKPLCDTYCGTAVCALIFSCVICKQPNAPVMDSTSTSYSPTSSPSSARRQQQWGSV